MIFKLGLAVAIGIVLGYVLTAVIVYDLAAAIPFVAFCVGLGVALGWVLPMPLWVRKVLFLLGREDPELMFTKRNPPSAESLKWANKVIRDHEAEK